MKYIISLIILFLINKKDISYPGNTLHHEKLTLQFQDTIGKDIILKGTLIDTVKESDIDALCEYCALEVRFKIDTTYKNSKFIGLIVIDPKHMRLLKKRGAKFSFEAKAEAYMNGPKYLIYSIGHHNTDVPIIWCVSIEPAL